MEVSFVKKFLGLEWTWRGMVGRIVSYSKIAGGYGTVRRPGNPFLHVSAGIAAVIFIFGLGILAVPSHSEARSGITPPTASLGPLVYSSVHTPQAIPAVAVRLAVSQDAGQATPPAAA